MQIVLECVYCVGCRIMITCPELTLKMKTRNPLDFWGANIPSAAGGDRAVCSVSLSVPETLTCDVVFLCPRVRLSGAERDARSTQCPAHSCLQQLRSGVVLGWGREGGMAQTHTLHVHLAIMSHIKFYLEALAKELIGMLAEVYIR